MAEGSTHLKKLEQYIHKYYPNLKGSHFTTLVDICFMSSLRSCIPISELLNDLYIGIFDLNSLKKTNGNIFDLLKNPRYRPFAERIKDITVGSNGGMANVGKGEWLLSLGYGINPNTEKPHVNIIKNGRGDLQYLDKNEEVKWNGGKVCLEKSGNLINAKFNTLIDISDKKWVPFRVKDKKKYSEEEVKRYNAVYWKSISGEENKELTDNELKQKIIIMSFMKVFKKSDSLIMFNDDGQFQRFYNIEDVKEYYRDKLPLLKGSTKGFECRANQTNPIALYCYVF